MTHPQSQSPSKHDGLDAIIASMERDLGVAVDGVDQPAGAAPGLRQAGGGGHLWGPSTPRFTSPIQLLAEVADNAQVLRAEVEHLISDITGEEPVVPRQRPAPKRRAGLLPTVAHYATEIADAHAEIARLVMYMRERTQ
jgi:hypothetical protein